MTHQIVIAFDGSAGAEEALRDLAFAGLPDRLEACVLSVSDPATYFRREVGESAGSVLHRVLARGQTGACHRLAEHACAMLSAMFPHWILRATAADGPASPAILAQAIELQADLVVMGAHGRSHCRDMLLGSCSRRVLMHRPCSVRIARPRRRRAGSHHRLLVAVDVSDQARARAAVAEVASRAWPANTEVHLIAVVEGGVDRPPRSLEAAVVGRKWRHGAEAEAQAFALLEEQRSLLRRSGCTVGVQLFKGDVPSTLVRYATEWEADCVFVALPSEAGSPGALADDCAFITAACAPSTVEVVSWQKTLHGAVIEFGGVSARVASRANGKPARRTARHESQRTGGEGP